MRLAQTGLSVGLLLLAGLVVFESRDYSYMTPIGPGPGFFPGWLAGGLAALALIHLAQTWRRRRSPIEKAGEASEPSESSWFKPLGVLAAISLASVALETLGFCLSMLFLNLSIITMMGRLDRIGLVFAVAGSLGTYHVFSHWLAVPLPQGWFGW